MARDRDAIPTGRARRATRATTALAPSTVRFASSLAASVMRSPESAAAILERRHEEIADHALEVLGGLRGGAMKLGQLASFVDVDLLPPEYRAIYQEKLGALRDSAPPMSWRKVRAVLEGEWGEPPESLFEDFDETAAAAASIGQVHRAVLPGGRAVAVKVQYPEIADAVAADLGLAAVGIRLARAMAPGLDPEAVAGELRERIMEELDYELEAQHQRYFARAYRGHEHAHVPEVVTELSRRRVLVSDWVDGRPFAEMVELPQADRDRIGELLYRFYFGSMHVLGRYNSDPHPGNYLLLADGRIAFLDFGSVKVVDRDWLAAGTEVVAAAMEGDAERHHRGVERMGYFHRADRVDPEWLLRQSLAGYEWFLRDAEIRIDSGYVAKLLAGMVDASAEGIRVARAFKLPPDEIMFRRMSVGVFAVLGHLRACANWHRIAREYMFGEEKRL
ncbi:MAG TPA: AarF/ABC1/UbiB kinase family protein [Thermoleophilaceae bacterium]|jgi:predicted unusual protein kinase regulating ubiquinone biosynthesis (AarF/ABC1/UbiB family)